MAANGSLTHYIEFKNVHKEFDRPILKDVSFYVDNGQTLAIIGRSGVGKSVSLSHIMGFLKPDSGQVFVAHSDITNMSEAELRKRKFGTLATIYPRAWVDPEAWSPDSDYRSQLTYLGRAYYNPGFYSSCFMTVQAALPVPKVIRSAL